MIISQGMEFMFTSITDDTDWENSLPEQIIEIFERYMEVVEFWLGMNCDLSPKKETLNDT